MDKLKMRSENLVDENIEFIAKKFPNAIVEARDENGNLSKMVDFDILKQELSKEIVESDKERYQMTWPGKKQAILIANAPVAMTLRPCKEDSVDFNNTQNIYIEGDNLDVLKVIRETYHGKVKMIYIDPPYNTGNDFVYNDDFATDTEDYLERSNQVDDQGNRMSVNSESNGRFHSDWLNMIYPRLKVAKDLLTDDGLLFVSIDDNEVDNMLKILKEIFNENNLINTITVKTNETKGLKNAYVNKGFPKNKEYLIVVAKDKEQIDLNSEKVRKTDEELKKYVRYYNKYIENIEEDCSKWKIKDFNDLTHGMTEEQIFDLKDQYKEKLIYFVAPDNVDSNKIPNKENTFYKIINNKGITNYYYRNSEGKVLNTLFLSNNFYKNLGDLWTDISTININKEICGMPTYANGQKPIKLLERVINYAVKKDNEDIIMDFFAGSSTTAHAVLNLNINDGGNRKFIMIQLPENIDDNIKEQNPNQRASTQKIIDFLDSINKPHILTEIGKERLRRASQECDSNGANVGFRVFKLDSSNMKDTYYEPNQYSTNLLDQLDENIKSDRTPEDLLFQVMLDLGLMLDSKIEEKIINGKKVFVVGEYNEVINPDLICCFDSDVDNNTVTEIAKLKPRFCVFRDSSMAKDSVATNFDQIFETYSPSTTRKVL